MYSNQGCSTCRVNPFQAVQGPSTSIHTKAQLNDKVDFEQKVEAYI